MHLLESIREWLTPTVAEAPAPKDAGENEGTCADIEKTVIAVRSGRADSVSRHELEKAVWVLSALVAGTLASAEGKVGPEGEPFDDTKAGRCMIFTFGYIGTVRSAFSRIKEW